MPENAAFKKAVRNYAKTNDLPYSEARRAVLAMAEKILDAAGEARTVPLRVLTIQQGPRENGQMPYPFDIDEHGYVGGQDLWDGDPWFLIGFEDPRPEAVAAAEAKYGPMMGRNIAVTRLEWLDDPRSALGLHPVFSDYNGAWATHPGEIKHVSEDVLAEATEQVAGAVRSADGTQHAVLDLTAALNRYPRSQVERLRRDGWREEVTGADDDGVLHSLAEITSRLLGDDSDVDRLVSYCAVSVDDDGRPQGHIVELDAEQAERWYTSSAHRR